MADGRTPATLETEGDVPIAWWMRPLLLIAGFRPSVRAAVLADAVRLRELHPVVGRILLPALAIGIPAAITAFQATTSPNMQGNPYDVFTLYIYDVFTESIPFMAAAALIGIFSPAAGAVLVLTYAVGNTAATVITGELVPVGPAFFGRVVSFLLLWILVVEIPLAARYVAEWWSYRLDSPRVKRVIAVIVGGLVAALLTQAWAMAAPLLITPVFMLTAPWGNPFVRAVNSIAYYPYYLSLAVAVAGTFLLGVRYLGPRVVAGRWFQAAWRPTRPGRVIGFVVGVALAIVLMSGLIAHPVDAAILVVAIAGAPFLARIVLRATRLAGPLARIAWPIRVVAGFGVSIVVAWVVVGVVSSLALSGAIPASRWFPGVIGVAATYFVMQLFMAADDVVAAGPRSLPAAATAAIAFVIPLTVLVALLALPAIALADDWDGYLDIPESLLKDAAAGIGGLAAMLGGLFGSPPPPPQGPPKLPEYEGPPGQDQGPKPRNERPNERLPEFAPPTPPPPPLPHWSDRFMPDGWSDFRAP